MKKKLLKSRTIFLLLIFLPSLIYSLYLYQTGKNFYKIETIHYPINVSLISLNNDPVANSIINYLAEDVFVEQILKKEFFNDNAGIILRNKKNFLDIQGFDYSYVFYFDYFGDKKNLSYYKNRLIDYMWLKYNDYFATAVKVIDNKNNKRHDGFLKLLESYKLDYESIKKFTNLNISHCLFSFQTAVSENNVTLNCGIETKTIYEVNENFFKSLFNIQVVDNFPMQTNIQKNYNPSYIIFSIISIISLTLLITLNFSTISSFSKRINK